jgi:hypothetical protein
MSVGQRSETGAFREFVDKRSERRAYLATATSHSGDPDKVWMAKASELMSAKIIQPIVGRGKIRVPEKLALLKRTLRCRRTIASLSRRLPSQSRQIRLGVTTAVQPEKPRLAEASVLAMMKRKTEKARDCRGKVQNAANRGTGRPETYLTYQRVGCRQIGSQAVICSKVSDCFEVRWDAARQPHHLDVAPRLPLQTPARLHAVQVVIEVLSIFERWYDGRLVAAGLTPEKPISARSSASVKASTTRTGVSAYT